MGLTRNLCTKFWLEHLPYVGQFDYVEMTWFLTTFELLLLCRLSSEELTGSVFGRCCRRRTTDLTFLWVVVCLRPRLWRFLPQIDGLLAIELLFGDFGLVFET